MTYMIKCAQMMMMISLPLFQQFTQTCIWLYQNAIPEHKKKQLPLRNRLTKIQEALSRFF